MLMSTAKDSFHGTGISLFQSPTRSKMGTPQDIISLDLTGMEKQHLLPDHFAIVPVVTLKKEKVEVNESPKDAEVAKGHLSGAKAHENCWLEHAIKLLTKDKLDKADAIAWSAYHASLQTPSEDLLPALTQLLPLFQEKAATAAMIKHGMDMLR